MRLTPAKALLAAVRRLPIKTPVAGRWSPPPSSATHRAHWVGWLDEYDGPGYYNRRVLKTPRSMAYIYGHIHCAPMLLWLAEAAGVPRRSIATANAAMTRLTTSGLSDSHPRTSTAVRKIIPWSSVHLALVERGLLTP